VNSEKMKCPLCEIMNVISKKWALLIINAIGNTGSIRFGELKRVLKGISRKKQRRTIFYDLCFCICAPQTTFKSNVKVINELKKSEFYEKQIDLFIIFQKHKNELKELLKPVRFYNNKARYLIEAKRDFDKIMYQVEIYLAHKDQPGHSQAMRDYLVDEVKGLGMKAASHFLRNLGCEDLAIIDVHIIKFLAEHVTNFTSHPTTYELRVELFTKDATRINTYKWLECRFKELAKKYKLTIAELDALICKL